MGADDDKVDVGKAERAPRIPHHDVTDDPFASPSTAAASAQGDAGDDFTNKAAAKETGDDASSAAGTTAVDNEQAVEPSSRKD